MTEKEKEEVMKAVNAGVTGVFTGIAVVSCVALLFGVGVIAFIIYAFSKTK